MIVRENPKPWELLFILRGSIIPAIWVQLVAVTVLSTGVTICALWGVFKFHSISPLPFSLIGIALSIFSGFRNSASYERWWEARKILGQHIVEARSFRREIQAYMSPQQGVPILRFLLLFALSFKAHLRDEATNKDFTDYSRKHKIDLKTVPNQPDHLLDQMSTHLAKALKRSNLSPQICQVMEERLVSISLVLAAAERIKLTPLPFAYSLLLHRTAYMFCFLLPFGLVDTASFWTPILTGILAYTFFGLDALGDELSAPFGTGQNCLPLDAITRTIEIDLRRALGEIELPNPILPKDFILS